MCLTFFSLSLSLRFVNLQELSAQIQTWQSRLNEINETGQTLMAEMIPLHQELEGIESLSDLASDPLSVSCESVPAGGVTIKDSGVVTMETESLVSSADNVVLTSVAPSIGELTLDQAIVSHVDATSLQSPDNTAMPTNVDMQELPLDESASTAIIGEFSPELPKKWATSPSVFQEIASIEATEAYTDAATRHTHMRFATISKSERTEGQLVVEPSRDGAIRSSPRTLSGVDTPTSSQVNAFEVSFPSVCTIVHFQISKMLLSLLCV